MRRKFAAFALIALLVLPALGVAMGAASLTVASVEASYESGEEVEIYGSANPGSNVTVVVVVNATLETVCNVTVTADEDGNYSCGFQLPVDASEGVYNVTASADGETAQASFSVANEDDGEPAAEASASEDDGTVGLLCAIDRALRFIDKIEAAAARLEENDYAVNPEVWTRLEDNKTSLTTLKEQLEADGIPHNEAARKLAELRGDIGRTMGLLHSTAEKVNEARALRFMEHMERRIQNMEGWIQRLGDKIEQGKAMNALQAASKKIEKIRTRLAEGEMEEAINDLQSMVDELDTQLSDLNGPEVTNQFKSMNRLKAQIQSLEAAAKRLSKKGVDTTQLMEQIRLAEELLNQTMTQLQQGNTEAAQELLQQAQETIQAAEQAVQSMIHPQQTAAQHRKGPKPKGDETD